MHMYRCCCSGKHTHTQELNTNPDSLTLMSMYPSKELTREFDEQTMIDLQLVPSGVIMVRTKKVHFKIPYHCMHLFCHSETHLIQSYTKLV